MLSSSACQELRYLALVKNNVNQSNTYYVRYTLWTVIKLPLKTEVAS